jgi:type II secretory pathway pseudopilin PulG
MRTVKNNFKSNAGDTIVEVLLSIAIVGSVIAGAYALASRSLAEGVSASEHSQAIKLAEAQIEALKSRQRDALTQTKYWDDNFKITTNPIPAAKNNFCLDTRANAMLNNLGTAAAADWLPQYNGAAATASDPPTASSPAGPNTYNAVCTDKPTNPDAAKFFININMSPTGNTPTYLVTVRWTPAGRGPISQTQIYYRF